jgi:hypothetical protein
MPKPEDLTLLAIRDAGTGGSERQIEKSLGRLQGKLPVHGPRADLEALGFVFEEPVGDLFVKVKFPEGWGLRSPHNMWSYATDKQGRDRVAMFYEESPGGEDAFCFLTSRYTVSDDCFAEGYEDRSTMTYYVVDNATGERIYEQTYPKPAKDSEGEAIELAQKNQEAWMKANLPEGYGNLLRAWVGA